MQDMITQLISFERQMCNKQFDDTIVNDILNHLNLTHAAYSVNQWTEFLDLGCTDKKRVHQKLYQKVSFWHYDPSLSCLEMTGEFSHLSDLWEIFDQYKKAEKKSTAEVV